MPDDDAAERPPMGPAVKRLIAARMTVLAIPPGTPEPWNAGAVALATPGNISRLAREATAWVTGALLAIKSAPDNPFGDDDEAIATALLNKCAERTPHA